MNNDLKNILANSNKDIDNQKLMDYIHQQLSKEDSHEVESTMNDDPFLNDAVEGLQHLDTGRSISSITDQLHEELQKQISKKKKRREKRKWKDSPVIYIAVIIILLLIIICYLALKAYL